MVQVIVPIGVLLLLGCAPSHIDNYAARKIFTEHYEGTQQTAQNSWFVLIEGDGAPWITRTRPPINPTPKKPIIRQLARQLNDKSNRQVLYVARPCQYPEFTIAKCKVSDWTNERFSNRNVKALIDEISYQIPSASKVTIIGYSGGGVMALQVAPSLVPNFALEKIVLLGTPVDVEKWTERHGFTDINLHNYRAKLERLKTLSVPITAILGGLDELVAKPDLEIGGEIGLIIKEITIKNATHEDIPLSPITIETIKNTRD